MKEFIPKMLDHDMKVRLLESLKRGYFEENDINVLMDFLEFERRALTIRVVGTRDRLESDELEELKPIV